MSGEHKMGCRCEECRSYERNRLNLQSKSDNTRCICGGDGAYIRDIKGNPQYSCHESFGCYNIPRKTTHTMSDKPENIEWTDFNSGNSSSGSIGEPKIALIEKIHPEHELFRVIVLGCLFGELSLTIEEAKAKAEDILGEWLIRADLAKPSELVVDYVKVWNRPLSKIEMEEEVAKPNNGSCANNTCSYFDDTEPLNCLKYRDISFCGYSPAKSWVDFQFGEDDFSIYFHQKDLAKPSEWISVDDRLPRDFMTIDVWIDTGEVRGRLTDFISDNRGFCEVKLGSVSPYPDQDVITHWQKLPSPPDKE